MIDRYKSYDFVEKIMHMEFYYGYELFLKCMKRTRIEQEEKVKDKVWDLYLIEIQNGCEEDFEKYYNSKIKKSEQDNLTKAEKEKEEERILKNVQTLENNKAKKRVIKW